MNIEAYAELSTQISGHVLTTSDELRIMRIVEELVNDEACNLRKYPIVRPGK